MSETVFSGTHAPLPKHVTDAVARAIKDALADTPSEIPGALNLFLGQGSPVAIWRLPTVKRQTGLGRSTIYSRISDGTFPKPISLGGSMVGWVSTEISSWIYQQIETSRSPPDESQFRDEVGDLEQHLVPALPEAR